MTETHFDVCVVGGGSGGFGAACSVARLGLSVLLVERGEMLGGTSVIGGVTCWERGVGGTGLPFDLYCRLKEIPDAVGIYSIGRHCCWYKPDVEPYRYPGGESVVDPDCGYRDTLQRYGTKGLSADEERCRELWHGVVFEPLAMAETMERMLSETGQCSVRLGTTLGAADVSDGHLHSVELSTGERVSADVFVDGTGDMVLCERAGCEILSGQDPRSRYGEPSAPETPNNRLNGITLIYRVTPRTPPSVDAPAVDVPETCWWRSAFPVASITEYPRGDLNMNMLPTMEGGEFGEMGYEKARDECIRRIHAHWHHLQKEYSEFRGYRLSWIAPELGVRESRRVVGEYVLTQHDVVGGWEVARTHPDIIAVADHAMDTHGQSTGRAGCGEVNEPYGIPFRCLLPRGTDNLLAACRGASFSSLAASSCRLSRTMMQLGQAAGTAAALSNTLDVPLREIPPEALRASLREQHAQVDWPMPEALREHLLRQG